MLDGFGFAPVCLEIDLTSYDGPAHHVARFRNSWGWLVMADATILSSHGDERTTIAAACDEHGNALPVFMADNLLACACSRPQPCFEDLPDEIESALESERLALQSRWLRDNDRGLRILAEDVADRIASIEGRARQSDEATEHQIADLRRRRRMPGLTPEARGIFGAIIQELEHEQEAALTRLTDKRDALRKQVRDAERSLLTRTRVNVTTELLYTVQWHARPLHRWIEVGYRDHSLGQGADLSDFLPGLRGHDGRV
jgi:hypothetical protein